MTKRQKELTPERRRGSWLGVLAYLGVLAVVAGALVSRSASASFSERALSFGRGLNQLEGTLDATTVFRINGQRMAVTSFRTSLSLDQVFDNFAFLCRSESSEVGRDLARAEYPKSEETEMMKLGVFGFRSRQDDGAMFCFGGNNDLGTLAHKAGLFARSGDLSSLGQPRYLFARRLRDRTHVLLVTGLGKLDLAALFPEGDAPGPDAVGNLRPKNSVRRLAVEAEGTSYALSTYETTVRAETAMRDFEQDLVRGGYEIQALPALEHSPGGKLDVHLAMRGPEAFVVVAGEMDGHTLLSTARVGTANALRSGS